MSEATIGSGPVQPDTLSHNARQKALAQQLRDDASRGIMPHLPTAKELNEQGRDTLWLLLWLQRSARECYSGGLSDPLDKRPDVRAFYCRLMGVLSDAAPELVNFIHAHTGMEHLIELPRKEV